MIADVNRGLLQKGEGYCDAAIRPLIDALAALTKAELQSFQDHLAQRLYDIDGPHSLTRRDLPGSLMTRFYTSVVSSLPWVKKSISALCTTPG